MLCFKFRSHFSFYKLDIKKSIKENLSYLTIIEYPSFIVTSPVELDNYKIIG